MDENTEVKVNPVPGEVGFSGLASNDTVIVTGSALENHQDPEVMPPTWNFQAISSSISYGESKVILSAGLEEQCSCPEGPSKCATNDCPNRAMCIECPATCGESCRNRRIQKHEWIPELQRNLTQNKGYGIFTPNRIKEGDFIAEYVGEIISEDEFKTRMATIYSNDTHHYCFELGNGLVIDGQRVGNEVRFINHSCEPNCEMLKWLVDGLPRLALFAKRDILPGEELTYDYHFVLFQSAEAQPCFCGSKKCRGIIGIPAIKRESNCDMTREGQISSTKRIEKKLIEKSQGKMGRITKKDRDIVISKRCFLIKNYKKVQENKDSTEGCTVGDRLEKIMRPWTLRYKAGSSRNMPLQIPNDDPKLARLAKISEVLYELFIKLTTAKDKNGAVLCEPFTNLSSNRDYNQLCSTSKTIFNFTQLEQKILRGEYLSISGLEVDVCHVLSAYKKYKPEISKNTKKIYELFGELKVGAMEQLKDVVKHEERNVFVIRNELPQFKDLQVNPKVDTVISCICGRFTDDELLIQCHHCSVWQHRNCMRVSDLLICDFSQTKISGETKKKDPLLMIQMEEDTGIQSGMTCYETKETVVKDRPNKQTYICDNCNPRPIDRQIPLYNCANSNQEKTEYLTLVREDGFMIRKNDTVYVLRDPPHVNGIAVAERPTFLTAGPLATKKCDIFRVETLYLYPDGTKCVHGYYYFRPDEANFERSRKFFHNEIFRSPITKIISINYIYGRCWVLDPGTYCIGRPVGSEEEHIYVCEFKVDELKKHFSKIEDSIHTVCMKPYAFNYFEIKLQILRKHLKTSPLGVPICIRTVAT